MRALPRRRGLTMTMRVAESASSKKTANELVPAKGSNKIFAWGFDAISAPGYGGGRNFDTPLDWREHWRPLDVGIREGGELQVEIGEDKTSDVERYRSAALIDNWTAETCEVAILVLQPEQL